MAWPVGILTVFLLTNIIVINSQDGKTTPAALWMGAGVTSGFWDGEIGIQENTSQLITVINVTTPDDASTPADDIRNPANRVTTPDAGLKNEPHVKSDSAFCRWYNIIVQGVISVIVSVFGVISNAFSILIFWPDRNKSASQALLFQLGIIDSLVLVIWAFMILMVVLLFNADNLGGWFYAVVPYAFKYGWGIANMIQMVSVWFIVVLTVQRYVAVCHPHKMRLLGSAKAAWIQLVVLSVVCVAFNIPRLMEYDIVSRPDGSVGFTPSSLGNNEAYRLWYRSISFYLVIFIIPVGLLIFFTISLIRERRASKIKIKAQPTGLTKPADGGKSTKADKGKDDITFALVIVDIIFIICQMSNPLRRLIMVFVPIEGRVCGTPFAYFTPWSGLGIFVNSATNFLVFCLCGKGFRAKVKQRFCSRDATGNASSGGKSTTATNVPGQLNSKAK